MEKFDPSLLRLQDSSYAGHFERTGWDDIFEQMNNTTEPLTVFKNTPGFEHQWASDPLYEETYSLWMKNNFNIDSIKWRSYYPKVHFDGSLVDDIASHLGLNSIHSFWISRLDSGFFAPLHCDPFVANIHDPEKGELKRYAVFITPSELGHIFILGRDHLYNLPVGTIIKWNNPVNELHIGINGSMKVKYMINVLGY
jgi:hypothetical protein